MTKETLINLDARIHHALIEAMMSTGRCPTADELARTLMVDIEHVRDALLQLESQHAVVLHPDQLSVWVIHPFSASPTHTWVQRGERGWWAPCLWCAFGVAMLVGGAVRIHTRLGGEAEPVVFPVQDGHPKTDGYYAHFAIPPRRAWVNVHHHCALLLPFRSEAAIDGWVKRHGFERGAAVSVAQTAALARAWYARHADRDFKKWTAAEARSLFEQVGLTGPFWTLDPTQSRF